jgi:putative oxidoreductase
MTAGLLVLRIILLVVMGFHGTTKLFGWFGGNGLDGAERFFASQGFRPPRLMAMVAGATETVGAILLGTGLATDLGVAMIGGVLTNVAVLHVRNGLDSRKHGFELELVLFAATVLVGLAGPGPLSLDAALRLSPPSWAGPAAIVLSLLAGLLVSTTRTRSIEGKK